mmetsp:Transcript_17189/g.29137  ORF Transcript_17189/g.29137 Transcript_17189/m.29137 type:complete len:106 (+) Transcript_17189:116-433(+)
MEHACILHLTSMLLSGVTLLTMKFLDLTVVAGEGFMMMGAFWFTLLRGEHAWKAYGVAALVYFGCTVDVGFISKTGWFTGEAGVWVDLILSYITIITAQPWTIFM